MTAPATFARKADASRWLASVEVELARGTWVDDRRARMTFGDWAERWLESTGHLKPNTRAGYASLVRSVIKPTLGDRSLGDIRRSTLQAWLSLLIERGLSPSRVRQAYRLVSQMMLAAQLDGMIVASPCIQIRLPKLPDHEPKVLTVAEVSALADGMRSPLDLFVLTLAYTGMRFGEAAGLACRYVSPDERVLVVAASLSYANGIISLQEPKSHQHRVVTLPAFLARLLDERIRAVAPASGDELLFTSRDGLPIRHPNFMRRDWQPACRRAGLTATPHDLRASHATWLYDAGWSPVEIAARLGHSNASVTTKHYARRVVGRDVEIAARLDDAFAASGGAMARRWHDEPEAGNGEDGQESGNVV